MNDTFLLDDAHPVLRDHRVHGRHVLPGLAYVDLLYQFFRANGHDYAGLELRDLTIYHPLAVEPGRAVRLEMEALPAAAGSWQIAVRASDAADAGVSVRLASAEMRAPGRARFGPHVDLSHVRASASSTLDVDRVYDELRGRQLVHARFMKPRGRIYTTDADAWCELLVGADALTQAGRLMFHPALLDAAAVCAGAATAAADPARAPRLLLPIHYESFRAAALLQRGCFARVSFASVRDNGDIKQFDIDFFDAAGRQVAELRTITCKQVRDSAAMAALTTPSAAEAPVADAMPVLDTPREPAPAASRERSPEASPARDASPTASAGTVGAASRIERLVRRLIASRLRRPIDEIRLDDGYYELGLDSAALLQLSRDIERTLGTPLPPTLLFEHTTIAALTAYLAATHGDRVAQAPDAAAPPAPRVGPPVPRLRGADADAVAIVAMAGRYPRAADIERYWENLRDGVDCVQEIPPDRWDHRPYFDPGRTRTDGCVGKWGGFLDDVDRFDARFFDIAPGEAPLIDPQQRLFLETVWTLLEGAGYTRRRLQTIYGGSVGVFAGAMYQHYAALERDPARAAVMALSSYGAIANRVSYWFGLTGPSLAIDTMCSSSLVAVHLACQALARQECRLAIAGGVNLSIHPQKYVGLSQRQLIASDPARRSFADGDGFIPAEAVGALLLKPLADAVADGDQLLGVIKGTASNHGGRAGGFAVPNVAAERQVIADAIARSRIDPRSIGFVEAAANGAALGDAAELAALGQVFGARTPARPLCAIGSAKATIGHAEAASGMAQVTKVLLQMRHGRIAPQLRADPPNPHVALDASPFYLPRTLTEWPRPTDTVEGEVREQPRRALVNSFGAGGSNASVVIEEYLAPAAASPPANAPIDTGPIGAGPHVIVCSARNEERLLATVRRLLDHVGAHDELQLAEIAYTLQVGREHMAARLAMVVSDRESLLRGLRRYLEPDTVDERTDRGAAGMDDEGELHVGVAPDPSGVKALISGKAGDALLRTLLAERDLDRLARLWSRGVDVPWEALHDGHERRIVPLPTYPFDRQRYWAGADAQREPRTAEAVVPASSTTGGEAPRPPADRPRTDLERSIAAVWEEVLGVTGIGVRDAFLDLGGSSLTGGQIIVRLRALFGIEIPVRAFIGPRATVGALAVEIVSALARQQDAASVERYLQVFAQP